jgi:hypothetical protein
MSTVIRTHECKTTRVVENVEAAGLDWKAHA